MKAKDEDEPQIYFEGLNIEMDPSIPKNDKSEL